MTLGERVKARRLARGLTQRQLGAEADISLSFIAAMEAGYRHEIRSHMLRRLARALKCSADDLIGTFEPDSEIEQEAAGVALVGA